MADYYSSIHIHFVLRVNTRLSLIAKPWNVELHKYITGIVQGLGHKMLAINSMPDHLHFFAGIRPNHSISELMRLVKSNSSKWINEEGFCPNRFAWTRGYGAFSHSNGNIPTVVKYILNQEAHHRKQPFREEFIKLLEDAGVDYDPRYLFRDSD